MLHQDEQVYISFYFRILLAECQSRYHLKKLGGSKKNSRKTKYVKTSLPPKKMLNTYRLWRICVRRDGKDLHWSVVMFFSFFALSFSFFFDSRKIVVCWQNLGLARRRMKFRCLQGGVTDSYESSSKIGKVSPVSIFVLRSHIRTYDLFSYKFYVWNTYSRYPSAFSQPQPLSPSQNNHVVKQ